VVRDGGGGVPLPHSELWGHVEHGVCGTAVGSPPTQTSSVGPALVDARADDDTFAVPSLALGGGGVGIDVAPLELSLERTNSKSADGTLTPLSRSPLQCSFKPWGDIAGEHDSSIKSPVDFSKGVSFPDGFSVSSSVSVSSARGGQGSSSSGSDAAGVFFTADHVESGGSSDEGSGVGSVGSVGGARGIDGGVLSVCTASVELPDVVGGCSPQSSPRQSPRQSPQSSPGRGPALFVEVDPQFAAAWTGGSAVETDRCVADSLSRCDIQPACRGVMLCCARMLVRAGACGGGVRACG
jgi:hypothetical protein